MGNSNVPQSCPEFNAGRSHHALKTSRKRNKIGVKKALIDLDPMEKMCRENLRKKIPVRFQAAELPGQSSLKKINVMDVRGKEKKLASGKTCYLISFLSSSSAA